MKKDLHRLLEQLEAVGCTVKLTGSGHYQIRIPQGGIVVVSSSPSRRGFLKTFKADLRRAGLNLSLDPARIYPSPPDH